MTSHRRKMNSTKTIIADQALEQPAETSSKDQSKIIADQLLPALVESSIRQARACGQTDLLEVLQRLHIILQARNNIHQDQEKSNQTAE